MKFISDNNYSTRYVTPFYDYVRQANGEVTNNFLHLTLKKIVIATLNETTPKRAERKLKK